MNLFFGRHINDIVPKVNLRLPIFFFHLIIPVQVFNLPPLFRPPQSFPHIPRIPRRTRTRTYTMGDDNL